MNYTRQRLGTVASTRTSNIDKKTADGERAVQLCNYMDVYKNDQITPALDFMQATASPGQIAAFALRAGDTVITKDSETADDIGIPAYVNEHIDRLVCGYHLAIVRPDLTKSHPRFVYWALRADESAQQWAVLATGVTRVGLRKSDIAKLVIPVPSVLKQAAIADFLDRETAQIDELIVKQNALIELLGERRTAVVTRAVTRGLSLSSPVRASSLEEVDEIPAAWEERPFLSCFSGRVDYRGATPAKTDTGVPLVTARNVKQGWIDYSLSEEFVSAENYADIMRRGLPEIGDVLMTMEAPLGNVALVDRTDVAFAQRVVKFRPRRSSVDPDFICFAMNSEYFQSQLAKRATGSTALGIKASKLHGLRVALPPLAEQQAIAASLRNADSRSDAVTAKARAAIALLQERRAALITAAVTGMIDVRGAA